MTKLPLSIKFFPNILKKNPDGIPIYARIICNRKKIDLSTRQHISRIEEWEPATQRVKGKEKINDELSAFKKHLNEIIDKINLEGHSLNVQTIKEEFLKKNKVENNSQKLIVFIREYINKIVIGSGHNSEGTVKNYEATFSHVESFLDSKSKPDLEISDFNEDWVNSFEDYLKELGTVAGKLKKNTKFKMRKEVKLKRNSMNKYHTKLKTILLHAFNKGLVRKNPYAGFKLKNEETHIQSLTRPELDLIEKNTLADNQSLIRVRDFFIFSVYSGLRWENAANLKRENIVFDGKRKWLHVFQKSKGTTSGKRMLKIPLLNIAEKIISKYSDEAEITGYLLPRLTNQKLNAYLKTIADLCGITKNLTHHVARHTFATTICMENGIPMDQTGKYLGHADLKSTQRYAKITNNMLANVAEILNEIFK